MSKTILVSLLLIPLHGLVPAWGEEPASRADSLFERVRAGDPEAVAIYERRFEEAEDVEKKKSVALFLAAAGRASEVHVRYLESFAREAVRSSRPFPFAYDAEGNAIVDPPVYTDEFKTWVESVSGDLEEEARIAMWNQPSEIVRLKSVEGPRADEILLAGLRTPNLMVRVNSLQVLVDHRHADLLPAMLEAIREMPAQLHQVLGLELLRLLDERADEAARELIGDDELYEETRRFFRGETD